MDLLIIFPSIVSITCDHFNEAIKHSCIDLNKLSQLSIY